MISRNELFKISTSFFSQYLNYKAAQQEYKNPFLNGLQMSVMMSGVAKLYRDGSNQFSPNLADDLNKPVLYGITTVIDDFLMQGGFTSKHYFTDIACAIDCVPSHRGGISPLGLILLGTKYVQEYFTGSKGLIGTMRDMQLKLNKNMDEIEYITDGAVNPKTAIFTQTIFEKSADIFFENQTPAVQEALAPIQPILKLLIQPILKLLGNIFVSLAISSKGLQKIHEKNAAILDSPISLLKTSSEKKYSDTVHDLDSISIESSGMLLSTMLLNSGMININNVFNSNKGVLPLFNLRNLIGELYNASDNTDKIMQLKDYETAGSKIKTNLTNNPRTIVERSGLPYYSNKTHELIVKQQELNSELALSQLKVGLLYFSSILDSGVSSIIEAFGVLNLDVLIGKMNFSASLLGLSDVTRFEPSLRKLASLYKFLETVQNTSYVSYKSHLYDQMQGIYLKDFDIKINGVEKLHMDNLFLKSGEWYLLTGKSGCGKTTLMSTLRGLPNFAEAIEIKGDAFYPKTTDDGRPQIYMLTQNNNFPYMVSIMEAILYPMVTTEAERVSYKTLVEELMLKMEGFSRNSAEGQEYLETGLLSRLFEIEGDIYSVTSGGQQKKMALTGLIVRIMKETGMLDIYNEQVSKGSSHDNAIAMAKNSVGPVLVLIDEVFNGLDSGMSSAGFSSSSKGLVMKTLKESLPSKAIVVSVEHQAQLDQYDHRIHLNGDGTHNLTDPKTGYVDHMPSFDTEALTTEAFDPFKEIISTEVTA